MLKFSLIVFYFINSIVFTLGQNIADFNSVTPSTPTTNFIFPNGSHRFQKIIESGEVINNGVMSSNFDFTAYVPINGSSSAGYLTINHELIPGGLTAMQLQLSHSTQLWAKFNINAVNFTSVNGTARNCSGGITPWGTIITSEELVSTNDTNADGYNDLGWQVEVNPATQMVINKVWAAGNGSKENMCFHANRRTSYFGNDANPGHLYKYVADKEDTLTTGKLYVYTGPKSGNGSWALINNTSVTERNSTMSLAAAESATNFNGIEDVEIGPDGKIYFAVKNESRIYRFNDSDPLSGINTSNFETYVGNASYNITHSNGTTLVPWGTGNDNLAFDGQGNLWVLQDGSNNYIWVVLNGHSQAIPMVKLFGISPLGSEPTGITFTPDYKYLFMSFQHPDVGNNVDMQTDAAGNQIGFDKHIALVIALNENLGNAINTSNVGIGTIAPKTKLHVKNGDTYIESIGTGVIMKSPDGNCWKITIDNNGILNSVNVPCPSE